MLYDPRAEGNDPPRGRETDTPEPGGGHHRYNQSLNTDEGVEGVANADIRKVEV